MRWYRARIFLLTLLLLAITGTAWFSPPSAAETLDADAVVLPFVSADLSNTTVDGVIGDDEYLVGYTDYLTGIKYYLEHDGVNLTVGIVSPTTGWIGIGFGPEGTGMDSSNMILGYVEDDGQTTRIFDGIGLSHLFVMDEDEGGASEVITAAGRELEGATTFEFTYPLQSADPNDYNLSLGQSHSFFVANHYNSDDLNIAHSQHTPILKLFVADEPMQTSEVVIDPIQEAFQYGVPSPITARVVVNNTNLRDGQVSFYRITTFGLLPLGTVNISYGEARFVFTPTVAGEITIVAIFPPTVEYVSSSSEIDIKIEGTGEKPLDFASNSQIGNTWLNKYVVGILTVVGTIWMVMISSVRLLFLIRREGGLADNPPPFGPQGGVEP